MGEDIRMKYEIVERIAVLGDATRDAKKELNLVSWNGRDAKLDLRTWAMNHGRAYKGVTLTDQEARDLYEALGDYLEGKKHG